MTGFAGTSMMLNCIFVKVGDATKRKRTTIGGGKKFINLAEMCEGKYAICIIGLVREDGRPCLYERLAQSVNVLPAVIKLPELELLSVHFQSPH